MIPGRITVVTIGAHDMAKIARSTVGWGCARRRTAATASRPSTPRAPSWRCSPSSTSPTTAGWRRATWAAFRGVTLAITVETNEAVDSTIEELRKAGATITKAGGRVLGWAFIVLRDPEGNLWEVVRARSLRRRGQLRMGHRNSADPEVTSADWSAGVATAPGSR